MIKSAVCKNTIASIVCTTDFVIPHTEDVHIQGEKKNWFSKHKTTNLLYKGKRYTLKELSDMLCLSLYIDDDRSVRCCPQVCIHHQDFPWNGRVESKRFICDEDALQYFDKLVKENDMNVCENE